MPGTLTHRIIAAALGLEQDRPLSDAEWLEIKSSAFYQRLEEALGQAGLLADAAEANPPPTEADSEEGSDDMACVGSEGNLKFPYDAVSSHGLPPSLAAKAAREAGTREAFDPWQATLLPAWCTPLPFRAPPQLSCTCRVLELPDGRQLAVTIDGLDEAWGVRSQAVLTEDTASPSEPSAKGWSRSNTCVVRVPENVAEKADLKGHHLLLFLALREKGDYIELLQSPMLVSFK